MLRVVQNLHHYYNLGSLVKSFGAKKAKAHTAAGDVDMTADLMMKILDGVKVGVNENLLDVYTNVDE